MTRRTTPSGIALTRRRARALQLRIEGKTFREIAEILALGNPGSAWKDVEAALSETAFEPVREALAVELARLDALVQAMWPSAMAGDVGACRVVLQCMARRASFLGLDSPSRSIIALADPGPVAADLDPEETYRRTVQVLDDILGPPRVCRCMTESGESKGHSNDQQSQHELTKDDRIAEKW